MLPQKLFKPATTLNDMPPLNNDPTYLKKQLKLLKSQRNTLAPEVYLKRLTDILKIAEQNLIGE